MNARSLLILALLSALPLSAQTTPATPPTSSQPAQAAQTPPAATGVVTSCNCPEQSDIDKMKTKLADWAQLDFYRSQDASLPAPNPGEQRVVFYGDSITWGWALGDSFPGRPYINRGISGQTTPQMLIRFQQDVVHLRAAVVIILAGTNDVAGNTGPETPEMIEDNFVSMAAIAKQSGIRLVIASILPAIAYPWRPGIEPANEIRTMNDWLKDFCQRDGDIYLDYYTSLADAQGGMKPGLSKDGVHPTAAGYAIMAPLADQAIAQALRK